MLFKAPLILFVICIANSLVSAQIDDAFCNSRPVPLGVDQNTPLPSFNISARFTLNIERNRGDRGQTEEIEEFYDGDENFGVTSNLFGGIKTQIFSYYDQDQILVVLDNPKKCDVLNLEQFAAATDFFVTTVDGKPHIITGFGLLLQQAGLQHKYFGDNIIVRGIPVKEWQACIYSDKSKETLKITISISDEKKWSPALFLPGFNSFPVQIKVEHKSSQTGNINVEYNVITEFRPGTLLNINNDITPPGIYCPGRINRMPIKFVTPNAFSFLAHIAVSNDKSYDGTLTVSAVDIDYGLKLARYTFYDQGKRITDIHDFDTGLSYRTNTFSGECTISAIDPNNPEPHQAYEFFQFNKEPEFQYVGQRRVRGINTDVWIAPRFFFGGNATLEWHFMADGWVVQETSAVLNNEPVLLTIRGVDKDGKEQTPTYVQISAFDRTRINYFDFDVSNCITNRSLEQFLRFRIQSDKYSIMKDNQQVVKLQILLKIMSVTGLSLTRLTKIYTLYDNGFIFVVFGIIEKPSFFGTQGDRNDVSLADAVTKITNSVNNGEFTFIFQDGKNVEYSITADKGTMVKLSRQNGAYAFQENEKSSGYSGSSLAGFIIGFLILGVVVGLVGGVFLILRRTTPLPGPLSFLNPSFSKTTSSA